MSDVWPLGSEDYWWRRVLAVIMSISNPFSEASMTQPQWQIACSGCSQAALHAELPISIKAQQHTSEVQGEQAQS